MSNDERQSPRTAIRNWLQLTEKKLTAKPTNEFSEQQDIERRSRHHSRRHRPTRYPSEIKDQRDEAAGRKHQRHNNSGTRQKRVTDEVLPVNSHQAQSQIYLNKDAAGNSEGLGLAERLGLHAPFRTFKDRSDHDILDVRSHSRKRRRSRSSTSSYLEPAAANDLLDKHQDDPSHATVLRTASAEPALGDRVKKSSPTASQGSEMMLLSPEKLLKSYERRPRHKTRQDRYELKGNNKDSEKMKQARKKDRGEKKQKKHKRKEKSGTALMHDFAAQNVAHDRLTLKPAKTLGLFGKGKASSPVRRRGLPDLAFSEMTFLTSRRERPKDSFEDTSNRPSDKKKQWKSTKALDTEAEFSRYFTSAKPASLGVTSPHGQRGQQNRRRTRDHESPQAYVDLPDRPFLGFGSCGPNTSISPAKIAINTGSRGLRSGDTRSSTRSTSYLTWSQSEGPSYASPLLDRRHHIESLASSKLSNRKRVSQGPHEGQRSMSPVSPPCGQRTFLGTQGAVSNPSSEHENPCKAPGQNSKSRLATGERLRSREKSQDHHDTRTIVLDAAKAPQNIEDSVHDKTYPAEASGHGGPEPVLPSRNQAACQFSGHEPRCEPQAHDTRPLSAQIPTISPHEDPLDDILEALLRDCNTKVVGPDLFPGATPIHRNSNDSEEARIPDRIKQRSRMPAHVHFNSNYSPENPASAFRSSRKPGSAGHQQASPHADPKSTHKLSRGSLNSPNRPNLGYNLSYPSVPTQNQVDSRNAWNGYDNLYERQHEQEDFRPETSREHIQPYTAVQDDLSSPSRETGHSAGPSEYAPGLHPVEVGDDHEDENCQEIRHYGWGHQHIDHETFYDSGASIPHESHEGFDCGIMAQNHVNDYKEREQSITQGADQHENEQQLFTANMSDAFPSWRSHRLSGSNYGLERCAVNGQVQDVDPILSGFWTPHKLY